MYKSLEQRRGLEGLSSFNIGNGLSDETPRFASSQFSQPPSNYGRRKLTVKESVLEVLKSLHRKLQNADELGIAPSPPPPPPPSSPPPLPPPSPSPPPVPPGYYEYASCSCFTESTDETDNRQNAWSTIELRSKCNYIEPSAVRLGSLNLCALREGG